MSWKDFYRRRDAIDRVLAHPDAGPSVDDPAVRAVFATRDELALALQYKWSQILAGRMAVALNDAETAPDTDHVEAVAGAWRAAARHAPALRTLLDGHAADPAAGPEFRAAQRDEARQVAYAAGLAEPGEPADEAARVGAAFLALVRTTPRPGRRGPIERALRRLVATA